MHEIDFTNSVNGAAMFADTPAWHGFGTVVKGRQTAADALRIAHLDWEVEKIPATHTFNGQTEVAEDVYLTRRSDTGAVLGAVGSKYVPFQNREAFSWIDEIIGEKLAIWDTAGSLNGGRKIFGICKLPGELEVTRGDVLEKYVLIHTTHDGTGSVVLTPTSVRVVCWNTLSLALRTSASALRIRHLNGSLRDRVSKARDALGVVDKCHHEFAAESRRLASKEINSKMLQDYFEAVAEGRAPARREAFVAELTRSFGALTNAGGFGPNLWTAYNTVSEYADWKSRVRGSGQRRSENRFASNIAGSSNVLKQRAYRQALALAS